MKKLKTEFEERIAEVKDQKSSQQEIIQLNNQFIISGKKMIQYIDRFTPGRNNKELLTEVKKYLAIEKSKIDNAAKKTQLKEKRLGQKKLKQKRDANRKTKKSKVKKRNIVVNDKVKIKNSKQLGVVFSIDKDKAIVVVGNFKIQSKLVDLVLV